MIELELKTTRRFKSKQELRDYLAQMCQEHPLGPEFWEKVMARNLATLVNDEPLNGTDITTTAIVVYR